jgi:hypothetical protein
LLVSKDERFSELHVGEDGEIRKIRPVEIDDSKWREEIDTTTR